MSFYLLDSLSLCHFPHSTICNGISVAFLPPIYKSSLLQSIIFLYVASPLVLSFLRPSLPVHFYLPLSLIQLILRLDGPVLCVPPHALVSILLLPSSLSLPFHPSPLSLVSLTPFLRCPSSTGIVVVYCSKEAVALRKSPAVSAFCSRGNGLYLMRKIA